MHLARSEAITRNMQVVLCSSNDGSTCSGDCGDGWVLFPDRDRDRSRDAPAEVVLGNGRAATDLDIASGEFADFIVFRPNGRAMAAEIDDNAEDLTYVITQVGGDDTSCIFNAVPQNVQADRDTDCGTMGITSTGDRTHSGDGATGGCW